MKKLAPRSVIIGFMLTGAILRDKSIDRLAVKDTP